MKWSDVARVFGNLAQDPERATVGEVLRSLDKMSKPEGRGQVQDIGAELVVGALRRAGLPDMGGFICTLLCDTLPRIWFARSTPFSAGSYFIMSGLDYSLANYGSLSALGYS